MRSEVISENYQHCSNGSSMTVPVNLLYISHCQFLSVSGPKHGSCTMDGQSVSVPG